MGEYEDSLASINMNVEAMSASDQLELLRQKVITRPTRRIQPDGDNPYGSDVLAKAQAIQRVLGNRLEFAIDEVSEAAVHWRLARGTMVGPGGRHKPVRVSIEAFMSPDFTDLDLAREFGLTHEKGKISPQSAEYLRKIRDGDVTVQWGDAEVPVSGNVSVPAVPERKVAEGVAKVAFASATLKALNAGQAGRLTKDMLSLSKGAQSAADTFVGLGELIGDLNDEALVRVRAEAGLDAIIMDIQAEILNGDDAVRERASKWLTEITGRITKALDYGEAKDG